MANSLADHLTKRRVLWGLALLVLVAVGVFAWQAFTAANALFDARSKADSVEKRLTSGDFDGAGRELAAMQERAAEAEDATDGVLWDLGRHLPWFGANIGAVQTSASVLHTVTTENAPIGLRLSKAVTQGQLKPKDGRIDLAAVAQLAPDVRRAAESIRREQERLAEVDLDDLTFPFEQVVTELVEQVDRAGSAAHATDVAFTLLPRMLGADEPRNYLLVIQNNAEIRATGGLPGSVAVLHADKGHVTMGWQGSARDLNQDLTPVRTVSKEVAAQYSSLVATDFRDVNFQPHFPEVARTAAAQLRQEQDIDVDGVVSVDPVTLALMLQGTGPVPVQANGVQVPLGFTNAVPFLLNGAYQTLGTQADQDGFFERAARAIFDAVLSGKGNERITITGMATGAAQHRIQLWSRHRDEQALLSGSAVAGEIDGGEKDQPRVGLYLNDSVAGKPEFYLDYHAGLSSRGCQDDRQFIELSMALKSNMPSNFDQLSPWITGDGTYVQRGNIGVNLRIYGPEGGQVVGLTRGGEQVSVTADRHKGRQVAKVPIELAPGERIVVKARIVSATGQLGKPVLDMTPGVTLQPNGVEFSSRCD